MKEPPTRTEDYMRAAVDELRKTNAELRKLNESMMIVRRQLSFYTTLIILGIALAFVLGYP